MSNHPSRPLPDSSSSTISGSGSFQSHLSTTNSQQRLRATNVYAALPNLNESSSSTSPVLLNPTTNLTTALRVLFPFPDTQNLIQDYHSSSRSWKALALKWMALVYCVLSFIFTSTALYKYLYLNDTFHVPSGSELVSSNWAAISTEQRFSRIFSQPGDSRAFDPYVLHAASRAEDFGITACLWTTDDEESLHSLVSWVAQWTAAASLVMVTKALPSSAVHQQLLHRLKSLQSHPSLSGLSLHLVHAMNDQYHPSAYLNLARLFANSPTVMLFPANPSKVLPHNFYNLLTSHIPHPIRKPLLVTSTTTSTFSIGGLTPVILPRNYQLWCSERAFLGSRTSDWDDCLWHLWLEEYGLGHANITITLDTEDIASVGTDADSVLTRTRNRLSGKYRAEMCELAIKRLTTDTPRRSKSGKRRLQWVKSFCRQTETTIKNGG